MNIMSEPISSTLSIIGEGTVISRMPLIQVEYKWQAYLG